jgi:hypothetical protein
MSFPLSDHGMAVAGKQANGLMSIMYLDILQMEYELT